MNVKLEPITIEHQKEIMDIFNYYIENCFAAYSENKLPYEFFEKFLQLFIFDFMLVCSVRSILYKSLKPQM
jgi:L-amino acid N-acyltransferase YncA